MKTPRFPVVLVLILVLVAAAYLAGTVVAASGSLSPAGPSAPAVLTINQLTAIQGGNALLSDDDGSMQGYLPLVRR